MRSRIGPSAARRVAAAARIALGASLGLASALGLGLGLAGCAHADRPGASPGPSVLPATAAGTWTLALLDDADGTATDPRPAATLDLTDAGHVSGSDGCAPFRGDLAITDRAAGSSLDSVGIRVTDLVSPALACVTSNGVVARYSHAVAAADSLTVEGDALTLEGGGATLRFSRGAPSPTPTPTPTASAGASALPAGASRQWALRTDPSLRIDLRTPGAIAVEAGCPSFTGDLSVSPAPGSTASAGTVAIRITRRPDTGAHCLAITAGEQEFVGAVSNASLLRMTSTGLELDGTGGTLVFSAVS